MAPDDVCEWLHGWFHIFTLWSLLSTKNLFGLIEDAFGKIF